MRWMPLFFSREERARDADGSRFRFTYSFLFLPLSSILPSYKPSMSPRCRLSTENATALLVLFPSLSPTCTQKGGTEGKEIHSRENEQRDHRQPPKTDTVSQ